MAQRTPHNELFLFAFEDLEVARAELAAMLPEGLRSLLDLSKLAIEPNRLVESDLSERFCDMLYSVPTKDEVAAYIWVLLEHQSSGEPMMGLRLLEYMVRVWSKLRRAAEGKPIKLPLIVPVVLQHDPEGWRTATQFRALYDADEATLGQLGALVPDFTYILDDLTATDADTLAARSEASPFLKLVLWSLKSRGRVDVSEKPRWIDGLAALARAGKFDAAEALLRYHVAVAPGEESVAVQAARAADPVLERSVMTLMDKLRAEGRAEGRVEGEANTLLKLIELKFGTPSEEMVARVHAGSKEDLDRWIAHILTATSLDDLFAE